MKQYPPGRNKAVIGYITIIGLFIAISMNSDNKDDFATRHLKNMCGLTILWIVSQISVFYIHYILGDALLLLTLLLTIFSAVRAYQGKEPNIPFLSKNFQKWITFLD